MADDLHNLDMGARPTVLFMSDQLQFSPAAWALLEILQQQAGVTVEVVHVWLHPVRQISSGEFAGAIDEPGVAEEVLKAIRTGEVRVETAHAMTFGVFPLRRAREVVGCLIVARRTPGENRPDDRTSDVTIVERTGALARTALESDLVLNARVNESQALTRRLHGILRFLGQLGSYDSDRDVMHAVLQAATVWFDLDCRIYERQVDGSFLLTGTLPGAEQPATGARIDAERAEQLLAARRYPSAGDLDDLGLTGRRDEVLLLPVGIRRPEWIILLAGALDQNAELTFSAIARVLGGELQARDRARIERWQERLDATAHDAQRAPEPVVQGLFEALVAEVGADGGRVTLRKSGAERALAAIGSAPTNGSAARSGDQNTGVLANTFPLSRLTEVRMELWSSNVLGRSATMAAQAWGRAVRPWLAETVAGVADASGRTEPIVDVSAFERRIQEEVERAKRFHLGLGLVLIGASPRDEEERERLHALVDVIRPELRASDLLGRVRGDRMAVVLVHAAAEGAESVALRLRERLTALSEHVALTTVQMGNAVFSAECASADALISQALRHAQEWSLRN
ncbi:MAG TPA: diguanylate cyclase [Vicinamibacterales bacterium]|jgi:hypothetical protein|nr:diguanylate cyclase [Vicinamibacterales bacterium]